MFNERIVEKTDFFDAEEMINAKYPADYYNIVDGHLAIYLGSYDNYSHFHIEKTGEKVKVYNPDALPLYDEYEYSKYLKAK